MLVLRQESCFWMEACAWQGVGHRVDVLGQFIGGSDLRYWQPFCVCGKCIQAGYWGNLQTYDYSTCIIQSAINMSSMSERPHEEQANSTVEKRRLIRLFVWLLDVLPIWSLLFSANNSYNAIE